MTLKCGSAKSFFMAALRTSAPTPRRMKGWKSEAGSKACTSSIDGKGASLVLWTGGSGNGAGIVGCAALSASVWAASSANWPVLASCLRRDHRLKKPSLMRRPRRRDAWTGY